MTFSKNRFVRAAALGLVSAMALGLAAPSLSAKDASPVKVTAAKTIQGTNRVVIGQFTVGYLIERRDSQSIRGGLLGGGGNGSSSVISYLDGYDRADLQKVADAAYVDFVAKLKAQGFTVEDRAAFAAAVANAPVEENLQETTTLTGKDDKAKVILVGASQTGPLRMLPGDVVRGGFGAYGNVLNGGRVLTAQQGYAKASGVRVIDVVYMVNFASAKEYASWNFAKVKTKASMALLPEQTKVTVVAEKGTPGVVALKEPVVVGGDFFTSSSAMTTGNKIDNVLGKAIGILGGVGVNSYNKVKFTAAPGLYAPGAMQLTSDGNTFITAQLAALR